MAYQNQPKWSTPNRKQALVALFEKSRGFCVFGHKECQIPEHHYLLFIDDLIRDWQAQDRSQLAATWQADREAMHSLGEHHAPINGRFNNISRDIFNDSQPLYYLETIGFDGLHLKPFARVKIGSSWVRLYVTLDSLNERSKHAKRKAVRHGKVTLSLQNQIIARVSEAVKHYLDN
jgi:hypothetical protein